MKAYSLITTSIFAQRWYYAFLFFLSTLLFLSCSSENPWKQDQLNLRLLEAIAEGNVEAVDSAINKGAFLESRAMDGATPLILAASRGQSEIIAHLLKEGANVNTRREGYYSSTALMEAAVNNDTTSAQLLLDAGADVHLRDTFGDPAINWGAYYGHVAYVSMLLDYGAKWDVDSKHGNALDVADKEWNLDLHDFFIAKGAGEPRTEADKELIQAVKNGNTSKLSVLLEQGGDPNLTDALGMPLIVWAAVKGHYEVLALLIESGAKVDAINSSGQTALSAAARFGRTAVAELLLNSNADVNRAGDRYHLTPIINAAIGGHTAVARMLLANGANINDQDVIVGYTPLMYAVAYRHRQFVELMIKQNANPYIKGQDGTGLYDLLSFSGDEAIAKMLEAYILEKQ